MLSTIKNSWPIAPSPTQTTTGYKHVLHMYKQAPIVEPLRTIGEKEWWTGVRIGTFGAEPTMVQVRVIDDKGNTIGKEWVQESNGWAALQWPIPGPMAKAAGLALEITLMEPTARIDPEIAVRISYHELKDEYSAGPLVFIDDSYKAHFYWDGNAQQLITGDDVPPGGGHVVHTMQFLLGDI
jgi:hypothetical protein